MDDQKRERVREAASDRIGARRMKDGSGIEHQIPTVSGVVDAIVAGVEAALDACEEPDSGGEGRMTRTERLERTLRAEYDCLSEDWHGRHGVAAWRDPDTGEYCEGRPVDMPWYRDEIGARCESIRALREALAWERIREQWPGGCPRVWRDDRPAEWHALVGMVTPTGGLRVTDRKAGPTRLAALEALAGRSG